MKRDLHEEFDNLIEKSIISDLSTEEEKIKFIEEISSWILDNLPERLFRYRAGRYSIDENGDSINYDIDSIVKGEIWGSIPSEFNDKFEGVPFLDIKELMREIDDFKLDNPMVLLMMELILNNNLPLEYRKILDLTIVENMKKNIKDYQEKGIKIDENEFKRFKKELKNFILNILSFSQVNIKQLNQFRNIVCFTTDYKSTLMWGHYADSHKGFVLEYDLKDYIKKCLNIECTSKNKCINLGLKPLIAPIIYEENRKQGNIYIFQEILNKLNQSINSTSSYITLDYLFLTKCLLRKSKEWEYEDEWRLFSSIYSNNDIEKYKVVLPDKKSLDYNLIRPKAIYMGIDIPPKRKKDLQILCKALEIPCYQMAVDQYSDKFEIDTEEELKKKYDNIFKIEN
ncbi:DUF2971 domain-containing protein [Fusobacterium mortiferum]|uniref:DUF2971 domain-containing protein n=1 Tax=Fusobacterium mortiferum TaxID=850 RepID=UPI0022E2BCA2|nr:DUF2971 domain-containing protein [Fusobacterium mortiferum]